MIDATKDFDSSDLHGRSSSEVVAELVRGAAVVKAANTLAPHGSVQIRPRLGASE